MKILIAGADGYLGTETTRYFKEKGHEVLTIDNLLKRQIEAHNDIYPLEDYKTDGSEHRNINLTDYEQLKPYLRYYRPHAIIHYAEIPSAPFSMHGFSASATTMHNNVIGTLALLWAMKEECPKAHLIKLGSLGEYGNPGGYIPEGYIPDECVDDLLVPDKYAQKCPLSGKPFPKEPSSFYHLSKVHDSNNILFSCKTWGLRATDLNQGVVYGGTDRIHYDAIFGTVLNRFCAQVATGNDLTVYGSGNQARGFLHISDTLQCVELALKNPANPGEMKVYNQYTETFTVNQLAEKLYNLTGVKINRIDNPRVESELDTLDTTNESLIKLGLKPKKLDDEFLLEFISYIKEHKDKIDQTRLNPTIKWK
jgi:UDP-sulfoquinovose synthase